MIFDMFFFIFDTLVMKEFIISFEKNDRLFEVTEESFDETGNKMWIFDLFKVFEIPFAEFIEGLVFLIDWYTFPEDSFLIETLGLGSEVVDKELDDDWDADLTNLVVLDGVDLFV